MKKIIKTVIIILLIILFTPFISLAARRALLVGIQHYDFLPEFSKTGRCNLKGPLNDVKAIKDALCTYYNFNEKEIKVLINDEATRSAIEQNFKDWLIKDTMPGDIVVFYFSGHGSYIPDFNKDENDGTDEVLLPFNMNPNTGYYIIIDDELENWLAELIGRSVVVVIDSCFSAGTVRNHNEEPVDFENTFISQSRFIPIKGYKKEKPSIIDKGALNIKKSNIPESVIFMFASGEDEPAWEVNLPEGYFGGFTFALCSTMKKFPKASYKELIDQSAELMKNKLKLTKQKPKIQGKDDFIERPAFK